MKKILMVFAVSTFFFACKNKGNNGLATDKNLVLTDTSLLHRSGIYSDTGNSAMGIIKQNMNGTTTTSSTTTTTTTTTTTGNANNKVATKNSGPNRSVNNRNTASRGRSTSTAPVKRDRGWSDAAKGTAIGAGSGAILGAVVSKDKVKGAVIGGVLGGAGGYAIGRDRDRRSGRVARNKKQ